MFPLLINVACVLITVNSSAHRVPAVFWALSHRKYCPVSFVKEGTRNKEAGDKSTQSLFMSQEGAWGGELHVARCGGGVLWHDRIFKISMQSSHEGSGGCGVS